MIEPREPNSVCVLGLGYIGLPTAAMFAMHGKRVYGVDTNPRIVATLQNGGIHIEEPDLAAFVAGALATGGLIIHSEPVPADAFIIAVPTPSLPDHRPDLSAVHRATRAVAKVLRAGNLVILESTSPPGTTQGLVPILEESGLRAGDDFLLAYSPERVLPGHILVEMRENDRVIGGQTPEAADAGAALYRTFVSGEILTTDSTTAELVKLMENTYRDVNIALANEFGRVATTIGIDVHEAIAIANHHPRVNILTPGPGVGGHCIAVDPWFIVDAAPADTALIRTARKVNDAQPGRVADLIARALAGIPDPEIALLGLAYKANVDDLRESPSLEVAHLLQERGYRFRLHDAHARALPDGTPLEPDLTTVLDGADAFAILTDHAAYRRLRPEELHPFVLRRPIAIDTRRCLDAPLWQAHGFAVHQLGVGKTPARIAIGAAP